MEITVSHEEFLKKFLDFANFKLVKASKPHNNYTNMADDRMKAAKCILVAKVTKEDVLVNFIFDKEAGMSIYKQIEADQKGEVENAVSRFGEVLWVNNEGNNPYIQVRKAINDFSSENQIFYWYKDVILNLYECLALAFK